MALVERAILTLETLVFLHVSRVNLDHSLAPSAQLIDDLLPLLLSFRVESHQVERNEEVELYHDGVSREAESDPTPPLGAHVVVDLDAIFDEEHILLVDDL